jgi:hypothetical protein
MACRENLAQRPRRCWETVVRILQVNLALQTTRNEMGGTLHGIVNQVSHDVQKELLCGIRAQRVQAYGRREYATRMEEEVQVGAAVCVYDVYVTWSCARAEGQRNGLSSPTVNPSAAPKMPQQTGRWPRASDSPRRTRSLSAATKAPARLSCSSLSESGRQVPIVRAPAGADVKRGGRVNPLV